MRQGEPEKRSGKKSPKENARTASPPPAACQQQDRKRLICDDRAREHPERWDGYS